METLKHKQPQTDSNSAVAVAGPILLLTLDAVTYSEVQMVRSPPGSADRWSETEETGCLSYTG